MAPSNGTGVSEDITGTLETISFSTLNGTSFTFKLSNTHEPLSHEIIDTLVRFFTFAGGILMLVFAILNLYPIVYGIHRERKCRRREQELEQAMKERVAQLRGAALREDSMGPQRSEESYRTAGLNASEKSVRNEQV